MRAVDGGITDQLNGSFLRVDIMLSFGIMAGFRASGAAIIIDGVDVTTHEGARASGNGKREASRTLCQPADFSFIAIASVYSHCREAWRFAFSCRSERHTLLLLKKFEKKFGAAAERPATS